MHIVHTGVTPRLLHLATFCQIFEKIRLKTLRKKEIPPDYPGPDSFLIFFCNSPGVITILYFRILDFSTEILVQLFSSFD